MMLNEKQARNLEAFSWLVNPTARREGRSYLLAYSLVRSAILNPFQ